MAFDLTEDEKRVIRFDILYGHAYQPPIQPCDVCDSMKCDGKNCDGDGAYALAICMGEIK